jgi:L-aminopeptidase/D-esterase-like protein
MRSFRRRRVLTEIEGVRVGHWTDEPARTGCTVVLLPDGTVASGEVRGGAPATHEFALLEPDRTVDRIDAVVLCGGSAFGLAATAGVMRFYEEHGVGFPTPAGPVPIVIGMALFDLVVGDASVRPGQAEGYLACQEAATGPIELGRVGAGTGATVAKWAGPEGIRDAGLGGAVARQGEVVVAGLFAVNALGDLFGDGGTRVPELTPFTNTTIGVVVTNARLSKVDCYVAAQSAHDGLARALKPAHTRADGDAVVVAATRAVGGTVDVVRELAAAVTEDAIRHALTRGASN